MQAVVWDGQVVAVAERPDPEPEPGMASVGVSLAGVCNTDLEIARVSPLPPRKMDHAAGAADAQPAHGQDLGSNGLDATR